jgi:hypothetical protein
VFLFLFHSHGLSSVDMYPSNKDGAGRNVVTVRDTAGVSPAGTPEQGMVLQEPSNQCINPSQAELHTTYQSLGASFEAQAMKFDFRGSIFYS